MPYDFNSHYSKAWAYLEERGVSKQLAQEVGFEVTSANKCLEYMGFTPSSHGIGILFHYPNSEYATAKLIPGGKLCPKGRVSPCYLSPLIDWDEDHGPILRIYESVIKATRACASGYPGIGGNGVDSVYTRKAGWSEFWPHDRVSDGVYKTIEICFDSNTESNANVAGAVQRLAKAVRAHYPHVKVRKRILPKGPEGDWGLDDFWVANGEDAFKEWMENHEYVTDVVLSEQLLHFNELNEEYVVELQHSNIVHIETGAQHSRSNFTHVIEAPRLYMDAEGKKQLSAANEWLKWEERAEVGCVAYKPGRDKVVLGEFYNVWRNDGVPPKEGDVQPWMDLMEDCIEDKAVRDLLIASMAYQVQERTKKFKKIIYIAGRETGTGKSTQKEIMRMILGNSNCVEVNGDVFRGEHTSAWCRKELAVFDDSGAIDGRLWGKIKNYVTNDRIIHRAMQKDGVEEDSYVTFWVTANTSDALPMDGQDRRVLYVRWDPKTKRPESYWDGFYGWLESGGAAAISYYLHTYDLAGFNPDYRPPMTEEKEEAVTASLSPEDVFLHEASSRPKDFWPEGRLYTTGHELLSMCYEGETPPGVTARTWAKKLGATMAFKMVDKNMRVRLNGRSGKKETPYHLFPGEGETPNAGVVTQNIKKYPRK